MLHRVEEAGNHKGIIVDHHHVRIDHLEVFAHLVESESILTRFFVGGRIVDNHTIGGLSQPGLAWVALKSIVEDLDKRRQ